MFLEAVKWIEIICSLLVVSGNFEFNHIYIKIFLLLMPGKYAQS